MSCGKGVSVISIEQTLWATMAATGVCHFGFTSAAALKKARELLQEGYLDVRICTPQGRILLSDEFDQFEA